MKKKKRTIEQVRSARRKMHHDLPGSAERLAALNDAIAKAGGIIAFARAIGRFPQSVTQWRDQRFVPLEMALVIEEVYGVPRTELVQPKVLRGITAPPSARVEHADLI